MMALHGREKRQGFHKLEQSAFARFRLPRPDASAAELGRAPSDQVRMEPGPFKAVADRVASAKTRLDSIPPARFRQLSHTLDMYQGLRKELKRRGLRAATNATLKMIEMITQLALIPNSSTLRVFCNAELPGAFIEAILYMARAQGAQIDWVASSYYPQAAAETGDSTILGDQYGMYSRNRGRWLMGPRPNAMPEGAPPISGDITDPAVVAALSGAVHARFGARPGARSSGAELYTSDAGIDVSGDYARQEELTMLLNFGHVLCGILSLALGGCMITKQYTFATPFNRSLIGLEAALFDETAVIKPITSRPGNSEVYIYARGFRGISSSLGGRLLSALGEYRAGRSGEPLHWPPIVSPELISGVDSALIRAAEQIHGRQQVAFLGEAVQLNREWPDLRSLERLLRPEAERLQRAWLKANMPRAGPTVGGDGDDKSASDKSASDDENSASRDARPHPASMGVPPASVLAADGSPVHPASLAGKLLALAGKSPPAPRFAWVALLMLGDAYLPGALVVAHSLRMARTRHDIVCMVTSDVSANARGALSLVYDRVVEVPYISHRTRPLASTKQRELYGSWIDKSFTKWNCLGLTEWSRVIFIDADLLFLKNCDELFDLRAPAACYTSTWAKPWDPKGMDNPYARKSPSGKIIPPEHGDPVDSKAILKALRNRLWVAGAFLMMFEPDKRQLANYISLVEESTVFGENLTPNNGADETSIALLYARQGINWTNIHQRYAAIPWKKHWVSRDIRAYHYIGRKPWAMSRELWPDLADWWRVAEALAAAQPRLKAVLHKTAGKEDQAHLRTARIVLLEAAGGIAIDAKVIASELKNCGYTVDILEVPNKGLRSQAVPTGLPRVALQVLIESALVETPELDLPADRSFLFVNHEYLNQWDLASLKRGALIALCKTREAERLLLEAKVPHVHYTGFRGLPLVLPKVPTEAKLAVHFAGWSPHKGTADLIRGWRSAPKPAGSRLFITCYGPRNAETLRFWRELRPRSAVFECAGVSIPAIERVGDIYLSQKRVPEAVISRLRAAAAIHLCPSSVEGWGHIIDQARQCSAVVAVLDAPPMNELVDSSSGICIPATASPTTNTNIKYPAFPVLRIATASIPDIAGAVALALTMGEAERQVLGKKARLRSRLDARQFTAACASLWT